MLIAASKPNSCFRKASFYHEFLGEKENNPKEEAAKEVIETIEKSLKNRIDYLEKPNLPEILKNTDKLDIYNFTDFKSIDLIPFVREYFKSFLPGHSQKISKNNNTFLKEAKTNEIEQYKLELAKKVKKMIEESTKRRLVQIQDDILHIILKALSEN